MGWAVVLLAAMSGLGHVDGYQQTGYACGALKTRGREGNHLRLNSGALTTRLLHTARNSTLYGSTFTVEMFAKFEDNRASTQGAGGVTLIGNMNTDGGVNQGWKLACEGGKCCLRAYLKQIPQTLQSVCTHTQQGAPFVQGQWFQITARYKSSTDTLYKGKAAIFINGIKHNEVEWGNLGRGDINYITPFKPFAIGGDASNAATSSFLKGSLDEVRLWTEPLTDAQILDTSFETAWQAREVDGSCTYADTLYDVQYLRIASVDITSRNLVLYIRDPVNEIASNQNIRGQPWINASSVTSGAPLVQYSLTEATRYIEKEPLLELLPTSKGVLADVFPRLASYTSRSEPDDVTVVVSQNELTVLDMRVRDPNYDDVVAIRQKLGFIKRFDDADSYKKGCVEEGIGLGNMEGCDDSYNDASSGGDKLGWTSFAGLEGYEGMHSEGSSVMNTIVDQFLDVDNVLSTMQGNPTIAGINQVRAGMSSQCRRANRASGDMNMAERWRLPQYLPAYTDVQSRLHVRLVWSHSLGYDWWMPAQGFEYDMVARSFSRYAQNVNTIGKGQPYEICPTPGVDSNGQSQSQGVCTILRLGLHAQFSPEFINRRSYPKPSQERQNQLLEEITRYAGDALSETAVADGDSLAVAVGETLSLLVRIQDRNGGDQNTIKAREDPGLPPGLVAETKDDVPGLQSQATGYISGLPAYPARSQLVFPPSFDTSKMLESEGSSTCGVIPCLGCKSNYRDRFAQDLSPPSYVDRTFTYRPREQHAGAVFKVCFYAETNGTVCSHPAASGGAGCQGMGLKRYDATSRVTSDLCVSIKVLVPTPALLLPRGDRVFDAIIGCRLVIPLELRDASTQGYSSSTRLPATIDDVENGHVTEWNFAGGEAATAYKYVVVPSVKGSQACSSSTCGPIAAPLVPGAHQGLPRGMHIIPSNDALGGKATLEWTPERGQEIGEEGYRVCFQGRVDKILPQYADLYLSPVEPECFVIHVRKCQECVRNGQSLESIARSLKSDLLSLQMYNPFLEHPDDIKAGTVLTTGPVYQVREGDYLEALSARFLVSVDQLMATNPDVALGNGTLVAGASLCVRAPVCDIKCKYSGSVCQLNTNDGV